MKNKGFTLIELLITLIVLSIALISVIGLMRSSVSYVEKTRQEVIAINLAREGMEAVSTLRDTNWLRRGGSKDANRLCSDPHIESPSTETDCGTWLQSGQSYILSRGQTESGSRYPLLSPITGNLDLSDNNDDNAFLIQYGTGDDGQLSRYQNTSVTGTVAGYMYREIRGYGLYGKDSSTTGGRAITCPSGTGNYSVENSMSGSSTANCNDSTPKEFRFCSRVEYDGTHKGKVELCGIITNYRE